MTDVHIDLENFMETYPKLKELEVPMEELEPVPEAAQAILDSYHMARDLAGVTKKHRYSSVQEALRCGQLMYIQKGQMKPKQWIPWVEKWLINTISLRTIQRWMKLYKETLKYDKIKYLEDVRSVSKAFDILDGGTKDGTIQSSKGKPNVVDIINKFRAIRAISIILDKDFDIDELDNVGMVKIALEPIYNLYMRLPDFDAPF
jgi:hypothetical protein